MGDLDADTALLIGLLASGFFGIIGFFFGWLTNRSQLKAASAFKIAEFRQAWINQLRDTLAAFHAIGTTPSEVAHENPRFYELGTKIQLLMNPRDENYQELLRLMERYHDLSKISAPLEDRFGPDDQFTQVSQRILKREWERLKEDVENRVVVKRRREGICERRRQLTNVRIFGLRNSAK